jgi:hypothetical protein
MDGDIQILVREKQDGERRKYTRGEGKERQ